MSVFALSAAPLNRKAVTAHLNDTFIPKVGDLNGFTMEEMLEVLNEFSNKKINFLYLPQLASPPETPQLVNTNAFIPANGLPLPPNGGFPFPNNNGIAIDPLTGMPLGQAPQLPPQPRREDPVMKTFTGKLKNLTLKQLVDIVEMSMNPPVQYVIMDWGVVFIPRDKNKPFMPTRVYWLNPSVFTQGLRPTGQQSPFGGQQQRR